MFRGKKYQNSAKLLEKGVAYDPAAAKGQYIKSCTLATTMGPGIRVSSAKML